MGKCKKCGSKIPNRMVIDGEIKTLNRRVYCLTCSPFGKHNTRDLTKPAVEINGELRTACNVHCVENRRRKKKRAIDYLGGKCCVCGYDKCQAAMDFHHVSGDKKHDPSKAICQWSWERVKEELDKCVLVCCRCHREIHHGKNIVKQLPEPIIYLLKCETCKKEFESRSESQMFCSQDCFKFFSRKVVDRPTKEVLAEEVKNTSYVSLGKKYGVSDKTIKKWAQNYKIV